MRNFKFICLIFLLACATSPLGRKQLRLVPNEQVDEMGRQAFEELKKKEKELNDEQIQSYVRCIAEALLHQVEDAKSEEWVTEVFKIDSPNAFALPGGRIGVNSGMLKLASTQDQLAAVMAHEVGHVIANHGNERISQTLAVQGALVLGSEIIDWKGPKGQILMGALGLGAQVGYLLPYSRIHESEADLIGLKLMAEAGFNPQAAVELWINMQKLGSSQPPEFFSTHPSHETRVEKLQKNMAEAEKIYRASASKPRCR